MKQACIKIEEIVDGVCVAGFDSNEEQAGRRLDTGGDRYVKGVLGVLLELDVVAVRFEAEQAEHNIVESSQRNVTCRC